MSQGTENCMCIRHKTTILFENGDHQSNLCCFRKYFATLQDSVAILAQFSYVINRLDILIISWQQRTTGWQWVLRLWRKWWDWSDSCLKPSLSADLRRFQTLSFVFIIACLEVYRHKYRLDKENEVKIASRWLWVDMMGATLTVL